MKKAFAHAIIGEVKQDTDTDLWLVPMICEIDGKMEEIKIPFLSKDDVALIEKHFNGPHLKPLELAYD